MTDKMSPIRTIEVVKQDLSPAVDAPNSLPGTQKRVADGLIIDPSKYEGAPFGQTVIDPNFSGKGYDMKKPSITIYEGLVEFPESGVYTFTTDLDELWIDGEKVISNPKLSRYYHQKAQKAIAQGKHNYRLVFNNMIKDGWPNSWNEICFKYKSPSSDKFIRPSDDQLSYVKK